jgi:large subunit ribosomal protein L10
LEKEKKVSKARLGKQDTVAEIERSIRAAKSMVFCDYKFTNVEEVTALRNKFRKSGVVFKVYKNTLMKIALNNVGITGADELLTGTLAVAFSNNDEITAAKIIADAKFDKKMAFKFGLLGNTLLDAKGVEALAKMPSKQTLIAQLMGLLTMGVRNLAVVINAVPRNLAVVVNARAEQLK